MLRPLFKNNVTHIAVVVGRNSQQGGGLRF